MKRSIRTTLKKKIEFGRFGLPVWIVGLAGLAVIGAAGQAIGPILAGNVTGTTNVTAQQSVVISSSSSLTNTNGTDKGLVVVNDNGTSFTAALQQHVGDTGSILHLAVRDHSNAAASAVLQVNVPSALDIQVNSSATSTLQEAMLSTNSDKTQESWLLKVGAGNTATLDMTIEAKEDAAPGTYSIAGGLVQISG